MKKKTQPKNTKKRTKAGENGFSYKLEALGIVYAALGLFMAVSLWYPEVGFWRFCPLFPDHGSGKGRFASSYLFGDFGVRLCCES